MAVAEPTAAGRVIAAWPSFALTASYELLMRQVRHAAVHGRDNAQPWGLPGEDAAAATPAPAGSGPAGYRRAVPADGCRAVQRRAWQWALANRRADGSLPTGTEVGRKFRRGERWGRLVKNSDLAGHLDAA
jgi:hypothetical protein